MGSGVTMEGWKVDNSTMMNRALPHAQESGAATEQPPSKQPHAFGCLSMQECWEDVFLRRYNTPALPGKAPLLDFVKLSTDLEDVIDKRPDQLGEVWDPIIADENTFFYQWMRLAGLPDFK